MEPFDTPKARDSLQHTDAISEALASAGIPVRLDAMASQTEWGDSKVVARFATVDNEAGDVLIHFTEIAGEDRLAITAVGQVVDFRERAGMHLQTGEVTHNAQQVVRWPLRDAPRIKNAFDLDHPGALMGTPHVRTRHIHMGKAPQRAIYWRGKTPIGAFGALRGQRRTQPAMALEQMSAAFPESIL